MKNAGNPILEEIWQIRAQIEKRYDGDLEKYCDDLANKNQTGEPRVVVASEAAKKRAEKASKPKYAKPPRNPILDEIRATRESIMREFNDDLDAYCDHLAAKGKEEGRVYVSLEPRRLKTGKTRKPTATKAPKSAKRTTRRKRSA